MALMDRIHTTSLVSLLSVHIVHKVHAVHQLTGFSFSRILFTFSMRATADDM
jgi:hypothetical protein